MYSRQIIFMYSIKILPIYLFIIGYKIPYLFGSVFI